MIKVKNSATALLLAFSMLCSIVLMTPIARAEAVDSKPLDSCITSVEIAYTNDSGQHTVKITDSGSPDTIEIQAGTTVGLKYEFALPDDMVIRDRDQFTISLPENLPVANSFKGKTGNIGKLGTYQINDDQTVTLTFNEYAEKYTEGRGGNFYVETSFSGVSDSGFPVQDVVFNVQGNTVTVPVETVYSVKDPTIKKDGDYNKDSGVTWTVTVHSGNDRDNAGLTDAIVTDTPGDYQDFTGNASLQIGKEAPQPISEGGPTTPYYEVKDSGIVFHLGDIPANTDAKIVYTSKVTDKIYQSNQDKVTLTNHVKLGAENITKNPSADGTADVPVDWIFKGGTYHSANDTITWTIDVNPDNRPLPAGATVTDTLAKFLDLDKNTVQVNGSDIPDKTGATGQITEKIYYKTAPDSNGQTKVTFYFTEETNTQQTITFITKIDGKYYNTNSGGFKNTATLDTPSHDGIGKPRPATTGTVGPSSSIISKKPSGSYDSSTHQLSWEITVNSNKMAITNPVVTDTIGNHQKIIDVTAKQGSSDIEFKGSGVKPFYEISSDEKKLTVHLKDFASGDNPVVLTVVSEVTDPAYYAVNSKKPVYNTAVLTGSNSAGSISQSVTAQQDVTSEVVKKSALGYHYDTRLVNWQIDVNQNKMPMQNAVITDTIPAGLTLQENTITFNGTAVKEKLATGGTAPYYTLEGSKLTIHLGNLTAAGTIQYDTAVDIGQFQNSNQSLPYKNTANLHFDNGTTSGVSSTATQTVTNSVIEKGYQYTKGNLYIDWKVLINRNQVSIGSGTDKVIRITDTLPEGLSLDTGSVAFYPVTVSNNGQTFTNGVPVILTRDNISYHAVTREFVFTFPKTTDLSKAYRLEFRTFVTDKTKSPFQNSVNFQGIIKDQSSTSDQVSIVYQSAGGDGWGSLPLGSITVLKQDDKDNTPLSGAEFTLYDSYGNPVQILTTDSTGRIVFSRLSYGAYSLSETKTPDGYKKSTYYKSDIQVSSASKNITLTVGNTKNNSTPDPGSSESSSSSGSESASSSEPAPSSAPSSSSSSSHGHSGGGGGGGGGSNSDVSSSSASSLNPSSVNPEEPIGENSTAQAGPDSASSSNPNEAIRDDDVGKFGPSPKTGETPLPLPALGIAMGAAILTVVVLRKKITKE